MRHAEVCPSGPKQLVGMVDEALTLCTAQELDALQDLLLQGSTEALARVQPVLPAGRSSSSSAVIPSCGGCEDLLGREARDLQHLEHARWHVGPHGLQPWCGPVPVQCADDLGEGGAHTRDLAEPLCAMTSSSGMVSVRRLSAARA